MAGKGITIGEYWLSKGVDMSSIDRIIDIFPEDSEASDLAKELMTILADESFQEDV